MLYHNQFNVDPGVYECRGIVIVVSDIVTHVILDEVETVFEDPMVVFRTGELNKEKHIRHCMRLSEFKSKFKKA